MAPQIVKAIDSTVGCMPGLGGKILLLKALHTHALTARNGEMK